MDKYITIDLHVHTALSACASEKNTPDMIVSNAINRGLDCIAITDHNTALNVRAVIDAAKGTNLLVVPGIEVETSEEVHLLALFRTIEDCLSYNNIVKSALSARDNIPQFFGKQILFDKSGQSQYKPLLSQSTSLELEEVINGVNKLNGLVIPAHIRRRYNGLVSILGFIPSGLNINTIELSRSNYDKYYKAYEDYNVIVNSDAHNLNAFYKGPSTALKVEKFDIDEVLNKLRYKLSKDEVIIY
jgi:hypothetical protein